MKLFLTEFETPIGMAWATSDERGALVELELRTPGRKPRPERSDAAERDPAGSQRLREQLAEYFAGERRSFELELAPRGTEFQHKVWDALLEIPYGATTSYGALAGRLGNPNASRAVGLANGKNPIWLVVPCHRVIGSNGQLTGYAGGLDVKRWLLEHEGALTPAGQRTFADLGAGS